MRYIKYKDIYGDVWNLISRTHVMRIKDGNIGGFFNSEGLTRI